MSFRWQEIVCLGLKLTLIPWFMREILARRKVTIVSYHDPSLEIFSRHISLFARTYSFIGIDQLTRALAGNDFSALPPKPMLVTIDDGHAGNARLLDVVRKYHLPVVIYAVAGVVDTNRGFWFCRLPHGGAAMKQLKRLPDTERRLALAQEFGHTDEQEYEVPQGLSVEQLRDFISLGASVGSHTVFHPLLSRCDETVGRRECVESRAILEEMLKVPVRHFALPNGDSDQRTRAWVVGAGYETCRTTEIGWVTPGSDSFTLPVFGISDTAGIREAEIQACGLWGLVRSGWRSIRKRN